MRDLFAAVKGIPIESVIREYYADLTLESAGRDLVSKCPLHDESTASFHIYTEKNRWHCFGACAKGGSAIDLLLRSNLASTPLDAAKLLAQKFEIETGEEKPRRKTHALTVSQYAAFCGLSADFLVQEFFLSNCDKGVEIPYKDVAGDIVSVQLRHTLDKGAAKKDRRFSWRKGDKVLPYGLWIPGLRDSKRLIVVEGASDVHVLSYCGCAALGVPGAGNFKSEMASHLLPFLELVLIQEPGPGGEGFVNSIVDALKAADYKGEIRVLSLPVKDPRELWVSLKDRERFTANLEALIAETAPIDLYPAIPRTADLIFQIEGLLLRHVFFKEQRYALLIAVWVLGTYAYDVFSFFGYLWLNSPEKRCGKSLLMDVLHSITAKATPRLNNATKATISRIAAQKHTMLIDEFENMRTQDREKYGEVMTILNAGFQSGGQVPVCERGEDGKWDVVYYDAFCPKILAGIARIVDTLEDRCFKIPMVRKAAGERVERFNLRRQGAGLAELRGRLELWGKAMRSDIEAVYDGVDDMAGFENLDDRFRDICEPPVAIALVADAELVNGSRRIWPKLVEAFKTMAGKRNDANNDASLSAMIELCEEILGSKQEVFEASADLHKRTSEIDGLRWITSVKGLASFLNKFDLTPRPKSGGKIRGYHITREWIDDVKSRYIAPISDSDPSQPSQTRAQSGSEGNL
jgi:hypothetical protein